jgi:hypothetical protein
MSILKQRHLLPGITALVLLQATDAEARVYCCKDARGQQVCGDVLPESCADRSYRELNRQGATVKQVDAPMTEAQRKKRDAELARASEEERLVQEQRRRDTTLLNTYTSEREIDTAQARQVADLEELLLQLRDQKQTLTQRHTKIQADMARYAGKQVPTGLKDRLETNAEDIRRIAENIAAKEQDLVETRQRFDEARIRFRQLTGKN